MNKAGSIRCRLAQIEVLPGRPHDNARHIAELARAAAADGMDMIVFPEMAIPGYLIGDEWEYASFLRECERCNELVRQASTGITVVFGSVAVDRSRKNEDGRVRKYNALFVAENGDFIGPRRGLYPFVIKTLAPNYREFDESRYFHDLRKLAQEERRPVADFLEPVPSRLCLLGAFLCEDAWDEDYAVSPAAELLKRGAELLINCSSSPFTLGKNAKRMRVYSAHAARYGRPLVYVKTSASRTTARRFSPMTDPHACMTPSDAASPRAPPLRKRYCRLRSRRLSPRHAKVSFLCPRMALNLRAPPSSSARNAS